MNYDDYNLAGATAAPIVPAGSEDPFIDDMLFGADAASPPPLLPRPDYTLFGADATGAPSPGNYDYMNKRGHSNSFSLPTDQLSLLTLRQPSAYSAPVPVSHLPSPNLADHAGSLASSATSHAGAGGSGSASFASDTRPRHDTGAGAGGEGVGAGAYYTSVEATEERTINPRQLLNHRPLAVSYSLPSLTTLFQQEPAAPHGAVRHRSVAGPPAAPLTHRDPLLTASSATPRFDFIMNDECFNAIHYWLNTTQYERGDDELTEIIDNPTGVLKFQRRRNSILLGVGDKTGAAIQKKRRRRLFNHDAMRHQRHNLLVESQIDAFVEAHPLLHDAPSPATPARGSVSPTLSSIARQHHPLLPFNHLPSQSLESGVQERTVLPLQRSSAPEAAAALPAAGPSPVFLKPHKFLLKLQALPPQAPAQAAALPRAPARTSPKKTHDDSDDDSDGEEKPFPCSECSKQFKRLEHLKRHTRSVHSNIRPFHCKYCDKKFSRLDNLAQHLKTHYKTLPNGSTTIILGNPNLFNRGGRKTKGT